jgi:hypothetical protein
MLSFITLLRFIFLPGHSHRPGHFLIDLRPRLIEAAFGIRIQQAWRTARII